LYLRDHLKAGILVGAGAYVIGHTVAASSRGLAGGLFKSTPVARAFIVGSLICALGLVTEVATSAIGVAALGLALATAGTSFIWPLAMSTVAQKASRPGRAVGAFTAAGYIGWVAGAPVVGAVSDAAGPAAGLLLMAGICLVVVLAVLAGAIPRAQPKTAAPVV